MKGSKNKWYMQLTQNQSNLCELKAVQSWKCMDMSFVDFVDCVQKPCKFTTDMQSFERCNLGHRAWQLSSIALAFSETMPNLISFRTCIWRSQDTEWNTGVFDRGKSQFALGKLRPPCSKQTYPQAFEATTRGASSSCQTGVSSKKLLATMPDGLRKVSITLLPDCITQEDGALLQFCLSLVLAGWGKLNPFFKGRVQEMSRFPDQYGSSPPYAMGPLPAPSTLCHSPVEFQKVWFWCVLVPRQKI